MEFRQLAYFVAVAEELHFRRAAERLHIAQPAVSQQVRRLEQELGVTLLRRTTREVALTDAGRTFLDEARSLLKGRDQASERARSVGLKQAQRLEVAFVSPATYSVVGPAVRLHRTRHPEVGLRLHELTTGQQLEGLTVGRLDVGFCRLPVAGDILAVEPLFSEPIICMLPEGHRLTRHAELPLELLAPEPFVMISAAREPDVVARYTSLCNAAGFNPRVAQEADQLLTMIGFVASGLGVALGPASLMTAAAPGIAYRPIRATESPTVETGLAWRRGEISPILEAFIETARTLAASGFAP